MNLDLLKEKVGEFLSKDSSGHDYSHAERVLNHALAIQKIEGGDLTVISCAALVHDICRPWEKETGKLHFGPEALEIIKKVLQESQIQEEVIPQILDVVAKHDIYDWSDKEEKSVELKIIQDADNLDALGAIGIARCFAFGGANGLDIYRSGENLKFDKDFEEDPNYRTTSIAHFYDKLLKLKDNMNTETGKKLVKPKHKFMESFLEQFFEEWN